MLSVIFIKNHSLTREHSCEQPEKRNLFITSYEYAF